MMIVSSVKTWGMRIRLYQATDGFLHLTPLAADPEIGERRGGPL